MSVLLMRFSKTETSPKVDLGSGEHGIGIGKREYLTEELGEGTVELMRTVKKAIDPHNLFNPGKVRYFLLLIMHES